MAKKKKNIVVLEDTELKPQVIGYTYKKKSNLGRVIFIFIVFILAVYYINDISVYINNLLGRKTAESIDNLANKNNPNENNSDNNSNNSEISFNVFSPELEITQNNLTLNNFSLNNQILTFDVSNKTSNDINFSKRKFYIELYSDSKTLVERIKLDINTINSNAKVNYTLNIKNNFYYIVLTEKTINDYPALNLEKDSSGYGTITCDNGIDNIVYSFENDKLITIKHTITNNNVSDPNYYIDYTLWQNKISSYNSIEGISASFNGTLNGYSAIINIDLHKANLTNITEKYYYALGEEARVVNFEMETYGFNCQ